MIRIFCNMKSDNNVIKGFVPSSLLTTSAEIIQL